MTTTTLCLAQEPRADALLTRDPLALLVGMLLDQQVPMERAFSAPADLADRLGVDQLDAAAIEAADPDEFAALFAARPALHRFPGAMAKRTQALCAYLLEHYDGDATALWRDAESGVELRTRLLALPGFGEGKAKIFLALLGKQRGVQPPGWREAAGPYGAAGEYRSVADITDAASLAKVREHKRAQKLAAKQTKN